MNILLICNKKNLLGNKLIIDSMLYCNEGVTFFILLTEDIGEQEKQNLINLVSYLNFESRIIFETEIQESLEQHFYYLDHLLYLSADTLIVQTIDGLYNLLKNDTKNNITVNKINEDQKEHRYPIIFFNFNNIRKTQDIILITHNNSEITELNCNKEYLNYFQDSRIGFNGKFSFNFNMPIIFWFSENNLKIYEVDLLTWVTTYPDFEPMIKQIALVETIIF